MLNIQKLPAVQTEFSWGDVQIFTLSSQDGKTRGELVVVVNIVGEGEALANIGQKLLQTVYEECVDSLDKGSFVALAQAVRAGAKLHEETTIVAAVYVGGTLYFAVWGEGQVRIRRAGKTGVVVRGKTRRLSLVSGGAREGDRFLIELNAVGAFLEIPTSYKFPRPALNIRRLLRSVLQVTKRLRRREIYLERTPPRRETLVAGIVFLLIIIGGIIWGIQRGVRTTQVGSYESILLEAQAKLTQAVELADLNPVRSRELAREVRSTVERLNQQGIKDERFSKLSADAKAFIPDILGEYIVLPRLLIDLSLVREGFATGEIATYKDRVLVLDGQRRLILSFSFDGEGMRVLAGPDNIPQGRLLTLWENRIFVLDGQRVAQVSDEGARTLLLPEGSWGKIVYLGAYGDSLYLVDAAKSQVWRYPMLERAGSGTEWLRDKSVPFEDITSAAIDGSIWMLHKDGRISKYTRGILDTFRVSGLEKELRDPKALVTNADLEQVYILDNGNSRIVILSKAGQYQAQYLWSELKGASGIAASERKKKLLVFVGSKVYEIELKN